MSHDDASPLPPLPRGRDALVLLRQDRPAVGQPYPCPAGRYGEAFYRLRLRYADADAIFRDEEDLQAESSPLFWDLGTPAQVLLTGLPRAGGAWMLSLTRWGVVRWEYRPAGAEAATMELESRVPLSALIDVTEPLHLGVSLAKGPGGLRVRLMLGGADEPDLVAVAKLGPVEAATLEPVVGQLIVGAGVDGYRPAAAEIDELLAANTLLGELFQCDGRPTGLSTDFIGGAALPGPRLDERTASVFPACDLSGTFSNYWTFCRVDDPAIQRVRIEKRNEMATRLFASPDRIEWTALPTCPTLPGMDGQQRHYVLLPPRTGPLYLACAPVYAEPERDRDLAALAGQGLRVEQIGSSRGQLPLHAVTLTDPATPPAGKLGVMVLCGQHSPLEQMTGHLGRPLLEQLARLHASGPMRGLLERLEVYWVPIFNIDTARLGLPGTTLDNANPNRRWLANQGPEQQAVQRFWQAREEAGVRPALFLDAHAGGGWRNHTLLTHYHLAQEHAADPARRQGPDRLKGDWLGLLDRHAGLREVWHSGAMEFAGCSTEWFQHTFASPAITLECGVVSNLDPDTRRTVHFTLERFRRLGQDLAHALAAGLDLLERAAEKHYD